MKITKKVGGEIPPKAIVKYTDMGHIKEIMYIQKLSTDGIPIKKLNKDEYMVLDTGEIKEYMHTENRSENVDNLRRTFKKIRHLINYNFHGAKNELMFTITYSENMTDTKRLYKDFEKFIKKLKYKYKDIDYLSIVEPQARGAWHCHILLRFNGLNKIYIPNKEIAELWGHGFVTVKAIKSDIDNIGAYLSAYLGDIEYSIDNLKEIDSNGFNIEHMNVKEVEGKKYIKGGRLHLYPSGMNIYRKSKGILEPESYYTCYADIKKVVGTAIPNYSTTLSILDDTDNDKNINNIIYEQYNLKRAKNQD